MNFFLFRPKPRKDQLKQSNKTKERKMIDMNIITKLKEKRKRVLKHSRKHPRKLRIFYHDRALKSPYFFKYPKGDYSRDFKNVSIQFCKDHLKIIEIFKNICPNYYHILESYTIIEQTYPGYNTIDYFKRPPNLSKGKARKNKKTGIKRQFNQTLNSKSGCVEDFLFNLNFERKHLLKVVPS